MSWNTVKIIGIVFIILKLTALIDWSWAWVLSPYWLYWVIDTVRIVLEIQLGIGKNGRRRGDK